MRYRFACFACFACFAALAALFPARASAQIVNVQPLIGAQQDQAKEGFSLAFEGSADVRRGNTSLVQLSGSAVGLYRTGRHLVFVLVRGDYGENNEQAFLSKDLEHARYRMDITGPLAGEVYIQHDRDDFRRLALRALAGAGPRVHFAWWGLFTATFGASYMLEHERIGAGDYRDAGEDVVAHRLSTYAVLGTIVSERLSLAVTMYAQPRVDQFSDVRVLCETALLSKATKYLSLKLALTSAYDSLPPSDVAPLDATMKGALQANF
jgi:hypothetical protein